MTGNVAGKVVSYIYDQVLELYFAEARMYDAADRRFTAVDLIKGDVTDPQTTAHTSFLTDMVGIGQKPRQDKNELDGEENA